jgi:hypothetical protein
MDMRPAGVAFQDFLAERPVLAARFEAFKERCVPASGGGGSGMPFGHSSWPGAFFAIEGATEAERDDWLLFQGSMAGRVRPDECIARDAFKIVETESV